MNAKSHIFVISLLVVLSLSGCNTVSGALEDVADTARNIRDIITVGQDIEDIAN